ncbi:Atu4866 domain-containing protein [Streptosporangium soli]|nr:Atu4866 domain-containing protein [Streptosporangium sp. KLBMP 9127]
MPRMTSLGLGTVLATALIITSACSGDGDDPNAAPPAAASSSAASSSAANLVGTWANDDGSLKLELRADGTFSEDLGDRKAAYAGQYTVKGTTLTLNDKTGVTADGTINGDSISLSGSTLKKTG